MVNYIIATWGGDRRVESKSYEEDRAFHIKAQINRLSNLNHSIDQITIVINEDHNSAEHPEFMEYINSIPDTVGGSTVHVKIRKNIGMSYGAWNYACEEYLNLFDYHIIVEDDYIPVIDNFDKILIEELESKNLGYLCACYTDHASVSNGIISSAALKSIYNSGNNLPYANQENGSYGVNEIHGQIEISKAFTNAGYGVGDYTNKYLTIFESVKDSGYTYVGSISSMPIFAPVNYMHKSMKLRAAERSDLPSLLRLKNESWFGTHKTTIQSMEAQESWWDSHINLDSSRIMIAVSAGVDIGVYKLLNIDWINRTANVSYDVFDSQRGNGYSYDVMHIGVEYSFNDLNLNILNTEVLHGNHSEKAIKSCGFIHCGTRVGPRKLNGDIIDSKMFMIERGSISV